MADERAPVEDGQDGTDDQAGSDGAGAGQPFDVAGFGLATAAATVERMLELGRAAVSGFRVTLPVNAEQPLAPFPAWMANGAGPVLPGPADGAGDPEERARQARRFRADAERLVELYADWTRLLLDGAATLAEQAMGEAAGAGANGAGGVLVLGPASAGATTTATAFVHVLDGPAAAPAPFRATDLVAHDGAVVGGGALTCTPDALDTATARRSSEVRVTVVVPPGTAPGTYHGHLLATGLPEVVLPVRLEVVA